MKIIHRITPVHTFYSPVPSPQVIVIFFTWAPFSFLCLLWSNRTMVVFQCSSTEQKLKKVSEELSCQRQNGENARLTLEHKLKEQEKESQQVPFLLLVLPPMCQLRAVCRVYIELVAPPAGWSLTCIIVCTGAVTSAECPKEYGATTGPDEIQTKPRVPAGQEWV